METRDDVRRARETRARKAPVVAVAVAVAVALVLGLSAAADAKKSAKAKKTAATTTTLATLTIQAAAVTVKPDGAAKYVKAKDGQILREGDAIKTDAVGKAEINYTDGSLTRLGNSTEFSIRKLTTKRGGRQTQGALTVGDAWNRAAKVSETGSFEVKAGGVTAAVEGTAFAVSCQKLPSLLIVCTIVDVVDDVKVTTVTGAVTQLTPATSVGVTGGTPGAVSALTYEELIQNTFIVENVTLDQQQGKGQGADAEFPPPTTTTTTTRPPQRAAPTTTTTTQPPPPPPPPTTAPPPPPTTQCNQNSGC